MAETTQEGQERSPIGALPRELQRLVSIEEVRQLKATYCRLLDNQHWDELAALFYADARFTLATAGEPLVFEDVLTWLAYVRPLLTGASTAHQVHQAEIDVVDADTVTACWAMTDYVIPLPTTGREPFFGYGNYLETYRRTDGEWRIAALELTRLILGSGAPPMAPPLG